MAHQRQRRFLIIMKSLFPAYFKNCTVIDIGSADINGTSKFLFNNCRYLGIDIWPGRNVDIVIEGHKISQGFDTVVSCECLEHDVNWEATIINSLKIAKNVFVFTCAGTGRPEHGTKATSPQYSPYTTDYYRNLTKEDILPFVQHLPFKLIVEHNTDLYFIGFKHWPKYQPSLIRYLLLEIKCFFYTSYIDYRNYFDKLKL